MRTAETQGIRTISVRIPDPLYRETQQIAARSKTSINALLNQALANVVQQAQDQEMYEAASLLGQDASLIDVDFAFAAQSEVAKTNE